MLGRSNCDIGTSIQCSTAYFMDGEINPIYADYMTYHHGSIYVIEVEPLLAWTLVAIWKHQDDIMQTTKGGGDSSSNGTAI